MSRDRSSPAGLRRGVEDERPPASEPEEDGRRLGRQSQGAEEVGRRPGRQSQGAEEAGHQSRHGGRGADRRRGGVTIAGVTINHFSSSGWQASVGGRPGSPGRSTGGQRPRERGRSTGRRRQDLAGLFGEEHGQALPGERSTNQEVLSGYPLPARVVGLSVNFHQS
jgi:hypothetical protein